MRSTWDVCGVTPRPRGYTRRVRLLAVVLTLLAAAAPPAFEPRDVVGFYVIGGHRDPRAWSHALAQDGITGVSVSAEWDVLEPQRGRHDWSSLDADVALVAGAGRRAALRIHPGISTPEWVYAAGARRFRFEDRNPNHGESGNRRNQTRGQTLTLPVPWDEDFLVAWEAFVAAAGAHYRDERAVAMVHVTGPNKHSAEMVLPRQPDDRQRWLEMGYTEDKLVGAWKRSLDAYARAFPRAALVLNLSPAILDDKVVERVVAYGIERHGKRVFLQNNILLGENANRGRVDWPILERYRDVTTIGFQRQLLRVGRRDDLDPKQKLALRRENFEKMIEEGLRLGARYFEIGADEARDFPDVVARFARSLR